MKLKLQCDGHSAHVISSTYCIVFSGFLRRPWIQGQPWKVLKFHKTENVLELFWKTSGRSCKVWNLPMWNFPQDLMTWWLWELPARVAIKPVEELPSGVFLSSTSRVVCYRMIDWKKTLNWPWIIEWKGLEKPWIFRSSGTGTLVSIYVWLDCFWWTMKLYSPYWVHTRSYRLIYRR